MTVFNAHFKVEDEKVKGGKERRERGESPS